MDFVQKSTLFKTDTSRSRSTCPFNPLSTNQGSCPFFRNNFPGLFQDSNTFFQGSQMHNNWSNTPLWNRNPKIFLQKIVSKENFITRVYRFPGLSKTCINFPGLSSPGKCQNKIPGLSRISRTIRTLTSSYEKEIPLYIITSLFKHSSDKNKGSDHQG